jgi:hypothetical protein
VDGLGIGRNVFGNWNFSKMWTFDPLFLGKELLFSQSEIDNPPSNFTGRVIQGISINWYP